MKLFSMFSKPAHLSLEKAEEKAQLRHDRYLLVIAGVLMGFAYPPVPFPLTSFFALVPLFTVLERRQKLIDLNRAIWFFGFITGVVSLYWVGAFTVGKDPFLMIGGGLMLFANPVFFLIPSTLYYAAIRSGFVKKEYALWFIPPFWASYEYFYMNIDLNFPWITVSNSLADFQTYYKFADVVGALGMTMLVIWFNIALYKIWSGWRAEKKISKPAVAVASLVLFVPLAYGVITKGSGAPTETVRVGLIQPNLDPYQKWAGGSPDEILSLYLSLSDKAIEQGAKMIIFPETALPVYLMTGQFQPLVDRIHQFADSNKVPLLTGMPHIKYFQNGDKIPPDAHKFPDADIWYGSYNSVLLFTPNSTEVQQYGKHKLVPFGERTPYIGQIPFFADLFKWGVGISSWNEGQDTVVFSAKLQTSKGEREVKFAALVCFESVFPYYVTEFSRRGAEFFAVVTNDSWYGNTSGPYQHKEFSNLRALENNRAVVRAANGGISCLITPDGHTTKQTKMYEQTMLVVDVPLEKGETLFTESSLFLPRFVYGFSLFAFFAWIGKIIYLKTRKDSKYIEKNR
ncbi:MAG: apolipoprotein N-acyltransferase [Ignavibacteriales bacterium]|nr:Apolipoprotein N-acyltransferase [Ignavibacteriaceae bacterium]MBW7872621.1 apolipoprotein N-acyltransferase [Ignavibacteria bacterium]MBZ0196674.1 apolipoprotein N-acyltransferase [Ignavibacteriaceae bacterium]MCZ2141825.1 apolipoprotein N-acyltransferase [Ignavibacteriales bacterium]WKZ71317.1 MAG: apolipoprotein N-acyltransferase [Ignavibacteriaceae bacterium]